MNELNALVDIVSALSDVTDGPLHKLRNDLPTSIGPTGPTTRLFKIGLDEQGDVGVAVEVVGTRADGRYVGWIVEAWIYPTGDGEWLANVKAEIDLDDREGDDRCVLNDQQIIADWREVADAIQRAARLVVEYPRDALLMPGWEPAEWGDDERSDGSGVSGA